MFAARGCLPTPGKLQSKPVSASFSVFLIRGSLLVRLGYHQEGRAPAFPRRFSAPVDPELRPQSNGGQRARSLRRHTSGFIVSTRPCNQGQAYMGAYAAYDDRRGARPPGIDTSSRADDLGNRSAENSRLWLSWSAPRAPIRTPSEPLAYGAEILGEHGHGTRQWSRTGQGRREPPKPRFDALRIYRTQRSDSGREQDGTPGPPDFTVGREGGIEIKDNDMTDVKKRKDRDSPG